MNVGCHLIRLNVVAIVQSLRCFGAEQWKGCGSYSELISSMKLHILIWASHRYEFTLVRFAVNTGKETKCSGENFVVGRRTYFVVYCVSVFLCCTILFNILWNDIFYIKDRIRIQVQNNFVASGSHFNRAPYLWNTECYMYDIAVSTSANFLLHIFIPLPVMNFFLNF